MGCFRPGQLAAVGSTLPCPSGCASGATLPCPAELLLTRRLLPNPNPKPQPWGSFWRARLLDVRSQSSSVSQCIATSSSLSSVTRSGINLRVYIYPFSISTSYPYLCLHLSVLLLWGLRFEKRRESERERGRSCAPTFPFVCPATRTGQLSAWTQLKSQPRSAYFGRFLSNFPLCCWALLARTLVKVT